MFICNFSSFQHGQLLDFFFFCIDKLESSIMKIIVLRKARGLCELLSSVVQELEGVFWTLKFLLNYSNSPS